MRMINIKKQISEFLRLLNPIVKDNNTVPNNQGYYTINNWGQVYNVLTKLKNFNFVKAEVERIFSSGIQFQTLTPTLNLDQSQYKLFISNLRKVQSILSKSTELISEFFPNDVEDQLNIKLPSNISLLDFKKIIDDLDYIFNKCQIVSELNNKEPVDIRKVDSGSIWLILGISSTATVVIGGLIKISVGICKHVLDIQQGIQKIRVLKSGASVIEKMEEEIDELIKERSRAETETFIKNNIAIENDNEKNEKINSLMIAMEKLIKLHFKGVEIYASLEAKKDVASLFPDQEEILKLANEILKLPAHNDMQG